jgi:hypothetical protein
VDALDAEQAAEPAFTQHLRLAASFCASGTHNVHIQQPCCQQTHPATAQDCLAAPPGTSARFPAAPWPRRRTPCCTARSAPPRPTRTCRRLQTSRVRTAGERIRANAPSRLPRARTREDALQEHARLSCHTCPKWRHARTWQTPAMRTGKIRATTAQASLFRPYLLHAC